MTDLSDAGEKVRADIIAMALESDFAKAEQGFHPIIERQDCLGTDFHEFANLVYSAGAAAERERLLAGVEMPEPVAARWPSVPGSHHYAGAGKCKPGSFGDSSEDLFTADQLRETVAKAVARKDAEIERLKAAVADEREACAKVCDHFEHQNWEYLEGATLCAAAIRARSQA